MLQSSSNRHILTSTVQRLCESGLHGQISAKKPLKDTNNKKRLAWAKKHEQQTSDQWKFVLWSGVQIGDFGSNLHIFVRCGMGERLISACVFPTVKHGGGIVIVWRCFAGDTVGDLFRIKGTLYQHGYHSILQRYAIPSGLRLVGLSFVFQNTFRLCEGYFTKKESDRVLHQTTWPPQSPDLNQSEMVWDESDRRVKEKRTASAQQIWELFNIVGKAFQVNLVERMPRVCKAVIKAKGGFLKNLKYCHVV
jgi:hypothetical protein